MIPKLFNYFGGKGRLARYYPPPKYRLIIEPFAGGAGYARNYPGHRVLLVDIDPRVVAIWRFLTRSTPSEILAIPLMEKGQRLDSLCVSNEVRNYLSCCMNSTQFRQQLSGWKNGQNSGLWGEELRARVAASVPMIKHWNVECSSYERIANRKATWFIDPPYQGLGQHYKEGEIDYGHLADWCRSREGQVIVCEREGADWLPFTFMKDARAMRRAGGEGRTREVVWTQG